MARNNIDRAPLFSPGLLVDLNNPLTWPIFSPNFPPKLKNTKWDDSTGVNGYPWSCSSSG